MEQLLPSMPEDPGESAALPESDEAAVSSKAVPPGRQCGLGTELDREFLSFVAPQMRNLVAYAYIVCRDRWFAEDLVQEALAKIYKVWGDDSRRNQIQSEPGYIYTAVLNAFRDHRRKLSRTNEREDELPADVQAGVGVANGRFDREAVWTIREAVRRLDDNQRTLVFLVYYTGANVSSAGRAVGLGSTQAHRLHTKALGELKLLLQELSLKK